LIKLLEPRPEREEADAQQGDQGGDDAVEAAPLGQDHAEAVQGQDGGLRPAELGERVDNLLGPGVEWLLDRHGRTLREHGCADHFASQR
jgi:hypothetical protein